ncbi:protein PARALOG OF AIPP2-like isoform X2 [Humulus lupulus]|uniref:protein PARALOG OF AIPP2-like isoform X2 n=1 Tax=Humulus lupulus TaxID=3486 RepID=UPI002B410EE9|nr:protein PARALOG OF AIPP2-like isoform X2 [Humulus lupulus]
MPNPNERPLQDLYHHTQMLLEPKITPVLRGSYRMQGPSDDTDHDTQRNMVSSISENECSEHSMSHKIPMRGESGACNVCAAPCSSCMHFNRSLMASKTEEFSDETGRVNVASQYSVNVGDTSSSFKNKTCDSLQQTTSETSNLMSVSSSHDSLSENADSKAALRSSDNAFDIEVPPLVSAGINGEIRVSPKPVRASCTRDFPNKCEDAKVVEAHDDDISCVSRANDAYVAVSNSSKNVDRRALSCSSASVSSLGLEESKKRQETPSSKDADASSSYPKDKLFDCTSEQIGASSKEVAAVDGVSFQKSLAHTDSIITILPKMEAEITNDVQESTDKTLKCAAQGEQDEKSSEFDVREPPLQTKSDDSDESDIVEHDVKVCDICGDAGREDMLAICSRCSDGAEHTYCMRKMLRKVPGSNWMCEECKFAEEINSQKQVEGKRMSKASSSAQVPSKRLVENLEAAPAAKRQALETSLGSPKSSSPNRVASLSRESSFKNLDRERSRPVQPASSGKQSEMLEVSRPPAAGHRIQKGTLLKSKSFSITNSKPKVRLVDEVVPEKLKGSKEHISLDTKERPGRLISKSMSFKSTNMGRSSAADSKVKMLSPRFVPPVDLKGSKQVRERPAFERKHLSRLDRPPVSSTTSSTPSTPKSDQASRVESSLLSFASNNRDSKVHSEGKSSTSKLTGNLARKPVETPVSSVGVSSASGVSNSGAEAKSNHITLKDEALSTCSLTSDKPSNNVDGIMEDGLTRSQDVTQQTEKLKESSAVRPRMTVSTSSKSTFCQKCKEIGHSAEFCTAGSSQASGIDSSGARSSREETHKGSKLKDAIQAALLRKPEIHRRKRVDQVDELLTPNTDLNSEIACQDQTIALNKPKNIIPPEGTHEMRQAVLGSSTSESMHTTVSKMMSPTVPATDSKLSCKVEDSEVVVPTVVKPMAKDFINHAQATSPQLLKMPTIPEYEYIWQGCFEIHRSGSSLDLCGGIQAHLSTCASPRVLEVAGKFPQKLLLSEVPRLSAWPTQFNDGGAKDDNIALYFFAKDLESYEKSYKGLLDGMIKNDLALKGNLEGVEILIFPSNQLPENSQRWNMLFFLWGVFRARKVHSADSSKFLLPSSSMMSVDKYEPNAVVTVSDALCLPKCIEDESPARDRSCSPVLASSASDQACAGISGDSNDQKVSDQACAGISGDCSDQKVSEPLCSGLKANSIVQDSIVDEKCTGNVTAPSGNGKGEISPPENRPDTETKPSAVVAGVNSCSIGEEPQLHCDTSVDTKDYSSSRSKILPSLNDDVELSEMDCEEKFLDGRVGATASIVDDSRAQYKPEIKLKGEDDGYVNKKVALGTDLNSIIDVECSSDSIGVECSSMERKRPHIDLSDRAPPASNVASPNIHWNGVNNLLGDEEIFGKRRRTVPSDVFGCGIHNCKDSLGGGGGSIASNPKMIPYLLVTEKRCVEACDEKVIPEDLGTTERRFFPVDPRQGNSSSEGWKNITSLGGGGGGGVNDDHRLHDGFPNLELALGAETKPPPQSKAMPFFVGLADKKNKQDKPPDKAAEVIDEEDDDSSSLSLSLSFPFPDKEEAVPVKAAAKSEQQLRPPPERHHHHPHHPVNTSLLLFRGFTEK